LNYSGSITGKAYFGAFFPSFSLHAKRVSVLIYFYKILSILSDIEPKYLYGWN